MNTMLGAPSEGINMVIILKRRIMNEIMTTYLPTILILIIVYITNFFKAFFFEAVVTVNLTALLVLTTLFISVSGHLHWDLKNEKTFLDNNRKHDSNNNKKNL